MRKDITKKFLMRENRYLKQMTSLDVSNFISKSKSDDKVKKSKAFRLVYDVIEFANVLSASKKGCLNTQNNVILSSYKESNHISKNGKLVAFNMVYCESGDFVLQGINIWAVTEKNEKSKIEKPFWLGETEVTQELFECVMGINPSFFNDKNPELINIRLGDTSKYPVERISWYDAIDFCNQLSLLQGFELYYEIRQNNEIVPKVSANGYRLPCEKEWEYAAKAGTNNKYAGCNNDKYLSEYAWYRDENDQDRTHPVATKKPNEWGFYDMSGNVKTLNKVSCYLWTKIRFQRQGEKREKTIGFRIARNTDEIK